MLMETLRFILYVTAGDALLWLFLEHVSRFPEEQIRFIVTVVYIFMMMSYATCGLVIGLFQKK